VLNFLEEIPDSSLTPIGFFLKGQSHMALEQYDLAIHELTKCSNNKILRDYSDWYIVLCYLKIGDPEASRSLLKDIIEYDSYYSPDALSLLKKLDRIEQ
jgi:tetratricopeptide (TPR) repeat protein